MRDDLEAHKMGKWVLLRDEKLIGTYDSFQQAANEATARFGRSPFLIRQVGAAPINRAVTSPPQSPNTPEARDRLLSFRRAIEESGAQLLTGEEIEKEIDEMRRLSTPCSSMFMLPMRSMVLSKSNP